MKSRILISLLLLAMASCGDNKDKETQSTASAEMQTNTLEDKAMAIITKSDCLTCHKVAEKLIGPSYKDVAAKYDDTPANEEMLVEKILKGGTGNWGTVAMAAHPNISKEDATTLVKYILSLRK